MGDRMKLAADTFGCGKQPLVLFLVCGAAATVVAVLAGLADRGAG